MLWLHKKSNINSYIGPIKDCNMKTIAVFSLLLLAPFLNSFAQAPWSIGAKAGFNYSILSVDGEVNDYSSGPGFHVGAFVRFKPAFTGVQSEFLFSNQRAIVKTADEELNFDIRYFSIPLLITYDATPSLHVSIGPQLGFLMCAKSQYHPVTRERFDEQHYTKAYKKTDFGLNAGVDYETQKGLIFGLNYYLGLADISGFDGVAPTKNRSLQLSIGYRYAFN